MRYVGEPGEYEADMAKIGEDEYTQKWWKVSGASISLHPQAGAWGEKIQLSY